LPFDPIMASTIAVYGLIRSEGATVRAAAASLGLDVVFHDQPTALATSLEREMPRAVLIAHGCDGAVEALAHLRGHVRYAGVPVLGLTSERTDLAFGEIYHQGGDDLASPRSLRGLVARLRQLAPTDRAAAAPDATRACAVVAGTSLRWRTIVGRMLTNAGLSPRFVNNVPDAVEQACADDVRFVVAADDLPPDGVAAALQRARAKGSKVPWIVVAAARRAAAVRLALQSVPSSAVIDAYAPPDHILFAFNELAYPQLAERRSSARVLFGTAVSFRTAGGSEDDVGFTYNINAAGLFVRTLAPLEAGQEVWLELWPPRTERAVRLVGRVAWRRAFGPTGTATVPPGFGVRLIEGLPGDITRWESAYWALAERPEPPFRVDVWDHLSHVPPPLVASTVG
jgi:hypothetical protein